MKMQWMALLGLWVLVGGLAANEPIWDAPEAVFTGMGCGEGPAWDREDSLYFTDLENSRIHRLSLDLGEVVTVKEETGRTNGLAWTADGRLLLCEAQAGQLGRWKPGSAESEVLAVHPMEGRKGGPNDVSIDGGGGIYYTVPGHGRIYRVEPGHVPGEPASTWAEVKGVNGVLATTDGHRVFATQYKDRVVRVFDVDPKTGGAVNEREFARLDPGVEPGNHGADGMCLDAEGRLYVAGPGHVWVFDAEGREVQRIFIGENATNVIVIGEHLYITGRTTLWRCVFAGR